MQGNIGRAGAGTTWPPESLRAGRSVPRATRLVAEKVIESWRSAVFAV